MALKYGDAVTLVQKSRDGTISRVNAIVLESHLQPPDAKPPRALKDGQGKALKAGEYLDLSFPSPIPDGHSIKSRAAEHIFRFAWVVPEWQDGAPIGWEPSVSAADFSELLAAYHARGQRIAELAPEVSSEAQE